MTDNKPILTMCVMTKHEICAMTVACFMNLANTTVNNEYFIHPHIAMGQSDLPKARSEQVCDWYDKAKPGDVFMFIDADQTFSKTDVETSLHFLKEADVVCGAYARKNGSMTVQPKDLIQFYADKRGELLYGSTGFMAFTYNIAKKIVDASPETLSYDALAVKRTCTPFFLERIVDDPEVGRKNAWLSEDYSFCWLARQHGAKIMGYISPTIGHIIPVEKFVSIPQYRTWPKNSVVYFCSKTVEPWSANGQSKGIGGSESAVINLAKNWVKRGYDVTVYCRCDDPGVFEGVKYENECDFNVMDRFNILIIWRASAVLNFFDMHAEKCILDLHDVINQEDMTSTIVKNTYKICVKSQSHASMAVDPSTGRNRIPESKLCVIPNGGAFRHTEKLEKDPNYLIYASSYDRGIAFILKWAWPKIKKACPNAYLKLFYGWNSFDASQKMTDDVKKYKNIVLDLMNQDGVTECGRISHSELLKEKAKANIHLYTGDFQEIDCISIRESACVGAIPVVSSFVKVFQEKPYCTLVDGDPRTQEMQERVADLVIELLQNQEKANQFRQQAMEKVPNETWENIADRWISEVFDEPERLPKVEKTEKVQTEMSLPQIE